jgi:hypothetical protein
MRPAVELYQRAFGWRSWIAYVGVRVMHASTFYHDSGGKTLFALLRQHDDAIIRLYFKYECSGFKTNTVSKMFGSSGGQWKNDALTMTKSGVVVWYRRLFW